MREMLFTLDNTFRVGRYAAALFVNTYKIFKV